MPDEAADSEDADAEAAGELTEAVEVASDLGGLLSRGSAPPAVPAAKSAAPVVAATVRLLAGLPADVPAAFGEAKTLREWAAAAHANRLRGTPGDGVRPAAVQAVGANTLLVWAALGEAEHRAAAIEELARLEDWVQAHRDLGGPFRPALLAVRTEADALAAAPDGPASPTPNPADHGVWRSAALGGYAQGPPTRPPWVLTDGTAYATGSAGTSVLMFQYPLAGEFAAEVAVADGPSAEAAAVYGGLMHEPHGWNTTYRARDFSGTRFEETNDADWLKQGDDRTDRIVVDGDTVTLEAAGRPVFRDEHSPAGAPFLGLAATDGRRPRFYSVQITGEPTIPREVDLLAGGRTDGWFPPDNNGAPPRPHLDRVEGPRGEDLWDFEEVDGENTLTGETHAGRLVYHRPLFDGERVRVEFRTVGTTATVTPCLDRVGFVPDPAGVRLRWMPVDAPLGRWDEDGGLPATHTVPAPGALGPVPLVPDDWNEAVFTIAGGRLRVSVNGTPVLDRDLSAGAGTPHGTAHADRLFGLAPAPGRRPAVRRVTLTGDWPASLPEAWKENLLRAASPADAPAAD